MTDSFAQPNDQFSFSHASSFATMFFNRRAKTAIPESSYTASEHIQCWLTFLMVCLASKMIAPYFQRIGFPTLTGNVVVGAICGPYALKIVSKDDASSLAYINMFALAYITTAAGAELVIAELKKTFFIICANVAAIAVLVFSAVCLTTKGLANTSLSTFTNDMTDSQQWSVAMIMAGLAVTGSPAAAVAVVRELQSKGKMTATFLGILMMIDVVVLIIMPMVLANADAEFSGVPFKAKTAGIVIATLIASCLLGGIVAGAFMLVMKIKKAVLHSLVFPIGFLVFLGCAYLAELLSYRITEEGVHVSFEPLLMCMVGGFITVNFSKYHHRFVEALEHAGPHVFLPFFTLVGASLDLPTFARALPFAIILSVVRAACIFCGSASSGHLLGETRQMNLTLWMTQISQAGFSLGLAAQIGIQFPGWGEKFQAVIISCVVVNQLIGPLLCKYALKQSGEAGKAATTDQEAQLEAENDPEAVHVADQHKAVIIGVTPKSKAIALALLRKRWGVTMLARSPEEATHFRGEVTDWAENLRNEYLDKHRNSSRHLTSSAAVLHHEANLKAVPLKWSELETTHNAEHPSSAAAVSSATEATASPHAEIEGVVVEESGLELSSKPQLSSAASVNLPNQVPEPEGHVGGHVGHSAQPAAGVKAAATLEAAEKKLADMSAASLMQEEVQEGNEGPAKSLEEILARGTSFDLLLPPGPAHGDVLPVGIHDVLDKTDHLRTVVLALDSDPLALSVLNMLQKRWGASKAAKIRVVVLVQDPAMADAVAELGAVAVHDEVSSHAHAVLLAVTPYERDAVLVHATGSQTAWSEAYLALYNHNVVAQC